MEVLEQNALEDEDLMKEDLVEAQETAGFHEIELRHAIGCHFNHLFLWSTLNTPSLIKQNEPSGKLKELVEKHFTTVESMKSAVLKAAMGQVLPGWVWLGVTKENVLVVTVTTN